MAVFDIEFEKVLKHEGGYVYDPDDNGGETFAGISRKANPHWRGWRFIDKYKKANPNTFKSMLSKDKIIINEAKILYKLRYWDIFCLDEIPSQRVANQLFDTCVNMGSTKAIKLLQETLGLKVTGKWSNNLKQKLMKL